MEEGSRRRTDGLGVVDVHAGCGQDDGVRAGRVGRPEHGSGVAGVADLAQHGNQLRAGVEYLLKAHVQETADRENALRGDRVRHRGEHFVGGEVGGGALRECLQVRVPVEAGLARVDLIDDAGLPRGNPLLVQRQGLPDGLRTLRQELAAL